ncbi:hypothetical protein BG015_006565 [Linnemannia schmuckeri]|uniref:F-box domain-containing protein n=1 Tax=Linnemannia schmuckeri TaxID=64567 RepID=A0A9P5VBZ9_9FUNG|nr:hypothetical protein BG015_006565 [Linnemannia schmuckeri]
MDPLSRLPVECLQHILQLLDVNNDYSTLASLLTTNKCIASAVLPVLYRDPYRPAFHQRGPAYYCPVSYETLTRMLLGRLPVASLSKALNLALQLDPIDLPIITTTTTTTTTNSSLDYLTHIRHFSMKLPDAWEGCFLTSEFPPHLLAYIQSDEFDKLYNSNPFPSSIVYRFRTREKLLQKYYMAIIQLDALWCLVDPILEQLQTFVIPVFHLKRYLKAVGRFKSLEKVLFKMSEMFDDPFYDSMDAKARRPNNDEVLQDMVYFIREHARLFKNRLKSIDCLDSNAWQWMDWASVERMQHDFFRLIPPLSRPTHLACDNWPRFSAHPHSTDLTYVQEFDARRLPNSWDDITCSNQSFIQGCRGLKRLTVNDFRAGTFKWAVQEKRELERTNRSAEISNIFPRQGILSPNEVPQPLHPIQGLIPLERITILQPSVTCADDIDDIVFAFNQTLKHIKVRGQIHANQPKSTSIGQAWIDLPVLTCLSVELDTERLTVDPQLLSRCPNLTSLRLKDMTLNYSCQEIVACQPARLEHLDYLNLSGWAALTFDPMTLSSTTRLKTLKVRVRPWSFKNSTFTGFIPPMEELNGPYGIRIGSATTTPGSVPGVIRPRWTWDWQLPLLTRLHLSSEFAFLFEFKMLYGCPALECLRLDIFSATPGEHTRVVCEADLCMPTSSNISICVPLLSQLSLTGEWVIDNDIIPRFLPEMFPGLKELDLNGWNMTTFESLLKLFRAMPQKYNASVTLFLSDPVCPSLEDMERLGIIDRQPDSDDSADVLAVKLASYDGRVYYHVLTQQPE